MPWMPHPQLFHDMQNQQHFPPPQMELGMSNHRPSVPFPYHVQNNQFSGPQNSMPLNKDGEEDTEGNDFPSAISNTK